jgi:hypothetical protein
MNQSWFIRLFMDINRLTVGTELDDTITHGILDSITEDKCATPELSPLRQNEVKVIGIKNSESAFPDTGKGHSCLNSS